MAVPTGGRRPHIDLELHHDPGDYQGWVDHLFHDHGFKDLHKRATPPPLDVLHRAHTEDHNRASAYTDDRIRHQPFQRSASIEEVFRSTVVDRLRRTADWLDTQTIDDGFEFADVLAAIGDSPAAYIRAAYHWPLSATSHWQAVALMTFAALEPDQRRELITVIDEVRL